MARAIHSVTLSLGSLALLVTFACGSNGTSHGASGGTRSAASQLGGSTSVLTSTGIAGGSTGVSTSPLGGSPNSTTTSLGGSTGGLGGSSSTQASTGACSVPPPTRHEAPYPAIDAATAGCGSWALVDNVCCAQYCSNDPLSESCDKCAGTSLCVPVNSKGCVSGEWPEGRCIGDNETWHYSRSTHYGLTNGGACAFGYYGLCTTPDKYKYTDPTLAAKCDAFCKAYPNLCQDPASTTLRGNFAAPQGNYYTQFWPSLEGDRDNYLSCGECFEMVRTKPDGALYQPGEAGYTAPVVVQITDSCPCSANSKWCCGSGRDHCAEVKTSTLDFAYGCPLPPGDLPATHDPQTNESIHLDLSDIAMARLQSGDPNRGMVDGVIPTQYRRVNCPVIGNIYVWLLTGASDYYFSMAAVNAAGPGSIVKIEAQLKSGQWIAMKRDGNYTSARPQERYGTWVVPQGAGEFGLPVSLRFTSPNGRVVEAPSAIKSWTPTDPAQDKEMYYIDTGVQF